MWSANSEPAVWEHPYASNYSKVKSLSEDFVKVCKNLCNENKSILESLANLEPKNES